MTSLLERFKPVNFAAAPPRRKRIQLADDDPAMGGILLRLLADEGYDAKPAVGGAEALVLGAVLKLDLVVLNLAVPLKDRWER